MEQASISRLNYLTFPQVAAALAAFAAAIVLVIVGLAMASDARQVDRVMSDEVKKIKIGSTIPGEAKPKGGLPELSQQIGSGDLEAAQKTAGGISGQLASVNAEFARRSADMTAVDGFSGSIDKAKEFLSTGDQEAAKAAAAEASAAWPGVESVLAQTQVDNGMLGRTLGIFALAWLLFTAGLVALSEKARPSTAGTGTAASATAPAQSEQTRIRGLNLTRIRPLRAILTSAWFPAAFQSVGLILLVMLAVQGVAGAAGNSESMTTILVWTLWWSPLMMLGLVLFGKLWCGACPLGAITAVIERFGAGRRSPNFSSRAGKGLLGVTPLAISLIGFIAMREPLYGSGYAVSSSAPAWTVFYFGIWTVLAMGVSLVYKRRAWCRYWCPVSAATSVIAKLSPLELSHGRSSGVSNCSTTEYPGNYLTAEKRCVYCMKCTQAYPDAPVMARLRLPGSAAVRDSKKIFAEAVMSLIIVAVFPIGHGLGQISIFKGELGAELRLSYFAAIGGCLAAYALVSHAGAWFGGERYRDVFARFGVAFLPIGVLFSVGQAVTGILGKGGNWLNATMPFMGIHGYWNPGLVEKETITAWQGWSMSWMTAIGGLWALILILAIARRHKTSAAVWVPMMALVVAFVILAKALPMPVH